jgi:hypothetical protein
METPQTGPESGWPPLAMENSYVNRTLSDPVPSRQRSRITNGSALLPGIDGRLAWVRRCKDIIASHLSDLGGEDNTSESERSIIRRASVMTVELERLEAKFASQGEASADANVVLQPGFETLGWAYSSGQL